MPEEIEEKACKYKSKKMKQIKKNDIPSSDNDTACGNAFFCLGKTSQNNEGYKRS